MNRAYQLSFCKRCKNKAFDQQKGIICSLTNEQANFQNNCDDFIESQETGISSNEIRAVLNIGNSRGSLRTSMNVYLTSLYIGLGFLFLGLLFIRNNVSVFMLIGASIALLVSSIYVLILIYRLWERVIEESRLNGIECPVETPGKAVGFLFIPFFNLYWIFIAYGQLPVIVNKILAARKRAHKIPTELGLSISILMVSAAIPFFGLVVGMVNGFILIPALVTRLVSDLESLPSVSEAAGTKHSTQEISISKVSDIKEFTDGFQRFSLGFNFKLILTIVATMFITNIAFILIEQGSSAFLWDNLRFPVIAVFNQAISIFFLIILFRSIKNIHVLVFAVAATQAMLGGLWNLFFSLFNSYFGSLDVYDLFSFSAIVSSLINGIVFMYLLVYGIRYFGITFWVFIVAVVIAGVASSFTWHLWATITNNEWYSFSLKNQITNLIYNAIYGLAFYLGIWWYLMPVVNKEQFSYKKTNTLDSNLE